MLNVDCSICAELFKQTDEVCVTFCGHMFHSNCINRWLTKSQTCPQCRNASTKSTIIRIFLNLSNVEGNQLNPVALVEELDNTKLQLNLKTVELDTVKRDMKTLQQLCDKQTSTINEMKAQCTKDKLLLKNYADQVKLLKYHISEMKDLHEKVKQQEQNIKELIDVQTIIGGSKSDYEKLLKSENDPKTLAMWVSALKRELRLSETKRKEVHDSLRAVQKYLRKELDLNKLQLQQFKDLESENYMLREKLKNANKDESNTTIVKDDDEQQAATANIENVERDQQQHDQDQEETQYVPKRPRNDIDIEPSVIGQSAETSVDSPYLNIKASLVGFSTIHYLKKKNATKASEINNQRPHNNDDPITTTSKLTKLQISPRKIGAGAIPKSTNKLTSIKNQQLLLMAGGAMSFPSNDSSIYTEGPVCSKALQLQQSTAQGANDGLGGSGSIDGNLLPISADTNKSDPKKSTSSIETRLKSGRLRNFQINKYKK